MARKPFKVQTHHFTSVSVNQNKNGRSFLKMDLKKFRSREFRRSLSLFAFFCAAAWGLLRGAVILETALNLKAGVFGGAEAGIGYMTEAARALASQNISAADSKFVLAQNSFTASRRELDRGNAEMLGILNTLPQTQSAKNLLDAAALLSQSGQNLVKFYGAASALSFSAQGLEGDGNIGGSMALMNGSLSGALGEIAAARQKLAMSNFSVMPSGRQQQFIELSSTLADAQTALGNLKDVFGLMQGIIMPRGTVLLLFENNNELRPGGGFIGTYGAATVDGGKINNLAISSIYDLDGQLDTYIAPPEPILNVNNRWYMRDSNWFADFPTDARKASEFYSMETGQPRPDAVIALTPSVIVSLLKITGPVMVPEFKVTLNADNFVEQTQAISTVSVGLSLNQPKQILADFFPLFMQKLKTLRAAQSGRVLAALLQGLREKQIVLSSSDPGVQSQIQDFDWAGQVFGADRDYLQMVAANLGGTKTDLSLAKQMNLTTGIEKNGNVTDRLSVTFTNTQPPLPDTENTSYIRFLVPQGSRLISISGFDQINLDASSTRGFRQDPDVAAWQAGAESGKTYFGGWLTVLGGQTRTVKLIYELPFTLQSLDRYSLVLQKQIGGTDTQFGWSVQFPGKQLQWESFKPDSSSPEGLTKSLNLDCDNFFGLVLQGR